MTSSAIDIELERYWSHMTRDQKRAILDLIKSLAKVPDQPFIKRYNKEIDAAVARIEGGDFVTHQEVVTESKQW